MFPLSRLFIFPHGLCDITRLSSTLSSRQKRTLVATYSTGQRAPTQQSVVNMILEEQQRCPTAGLNGVEFVPP